jgi:hypothetical protein
MMPVLASETLRELVILREVSDAKTGIMSRQAWGGILTSEKPKVGIPPQPATPIASEIWA